MNTLITITMCLEVILGAGTTVFTNFNAFPLLWILAFTNIGVASALSYLDTKMEEVKNEAKNNGT